MTRLPVGLACLLAAALLAAVGYVLLRPRWRWERPVPWHYQAAVDAAKGSKSVFTTSSPRSVTSGASNGRSATLSSIDDAARWAGR